MVNMDRDKTMRKQQDWKRVTIYLLPEEHKEFRLIVLNKETNMSEYAREAIISKMRKNKTQE